MKAKTLLAKLERLQSDIYTYMDELESKAENSTRNATKQKYSEAAEKANESAFELGISIDKMNSVISKLEN